ncbi:MAG: hypothetical protein LBF97_06040 [Elusimicrobiota bacterium]|jgi:phosphoenolpyruvate synthase/pyruvate phosphate dikinase|nr:hypothetical protein [Elusimicrobiota bacterium]
MDFLEKIVIELDELKGKIARLTNKIEETLKRHRDEEWTKEENEEYEMLRLQKNAMQLYSFILKKRIEFYSNQRK